MATKNIFKGKNNGVDRWIVQLVVNGKKKRKFFKTENDAKRFLKDFQQSTKDGINDIAQLPNLVINDIRAALLKLPNGVGLIDCVDFWLSRNATNSKNLKDCAIEFSRIRQSAPITQKEKTNINSRLKKLHNLEFNKITGASIIDLVKSWQIAPKTQKDYIVLYSSFFAWAKSRNYIKDNPLDSIHNADKPKVPKSIIKTESVNNIKKFFESAKIKYPEYVGRWALAAFAGLRVGEAYLLEHSMIDMNKKNILVPAEIAKTRDNWLQTNLPPNLWKWLEKYPIGTVCPPKIVYAYKKLNRTNKLQPNALRHAFATYHLSLYDNAPATSLLLKHRSPDKLWQNYLGAKVESSVAKKYFNIKP